VLARELHTKPQVLSTDIFKTGSSTSEKAAATGSIPVNAMGGGAQSGVQIPGGRFVRRLYPPRARPDLIVVESESPVGTDGMPEDPDAISPTK
jgi:hypothetical protein